MYIIIMGYFMLFFGSILSLSSLNWFMVWVGLEINLFGMLILMKESLNQKGLESLIKYFIIQVFSSLFLMFFILSKSWMFMFLPLLIKISCTPFHFWFIPVLNGLEWNMVLMLISWQKLAPLVLLFNMKLSVYLIMLFSVLSSLVGSIMGLFQIKVKNIIGYSSIYHISWFLLLLKTLNYFCIIYLTLYSVLNYSAIKIFKVMKINTIFSVLSKGGPSMFFLSLSMMSLSGLPPFFGFYLKWYIMTNLITMFMMVIFILLMLSILNLYFYLQIIFSAFTLANSKSSLKLVNKGSIIFLWFFFMLFMF